MNNFRCWPTGRAAFFYSLLSALSTFGFGSVYTMAHGIGSIVSPQEALSAAPETWAVLGACVVCAGVWKDCVCAGVCVCGGGSHVRTPCYRVVHD
jgi:hypothetical protein